MSPNPQGQVTGPFNVNPQAEPFDSWQVPHTNLMPVANPRTYQGAGDSVALAVARATAAATALGLPLYIPVEYGGAPSLSNMNVTGAIPSGTYVQPVTGSGAPALVPTVTVPAATGTASTDNGAISTALSTTGANIAQLQAGTYAINTGVAVSSTGPRWLQGAGMYSTTLQGGVGSGATINVQGTRGTHLPFFVIQDLTIDLQSVANAAGILYEFVDRLIVRRCRIINTAFKHVQFASDTTYLTTDNGVLLFEDCIFGASTSISSVESVTVADCTEARFLGCTWATGNTNYPPNILYYQQTTRSVVTDCTFDSVCLVDLSCNDVHFVDSTWNFPAGAAHTAINTGESDHGFFGWSYVYDLKTTRCTFNNGLVQNASVRGYRDFGSTFYKTYAEAYQASTFAGASAATDWVLVGTTFRDNNQQTSLWGQVYVADANQSDITLIGCTVDDDQGSPTSGNFFTLNANGNVGLRALGCSYTGTAANSSAFQGAFTLGANSYEKNTIGVNPVGSVTVAVPASGSAVASAPYDRTFYVSTVAGTTSCSMAIQNGPTITFVASTAQVHAIRVPAGKTVTPTYTGTAPTWVVEGE